MNQHLICTRCGIDHSSFFRDTAIAMKVLGVICGTVGVAIVEFSDQLKTDGTITHPYEVWLCAGMFIVIGFLMFVREWKE